MAWCVVRRRLFTLLLSSTLLLIAAAVHAQSVSGTVLGTVTDASGSVMAGAKIAVINEGTGLTRNVVSDAAGEYTAPQLPPGRYVITVELTGFKGTTLTNIVVGVDQRVRIDVKLEVGAMSESVSVTAEAPLLQTSSSELGTTVTTTQIEALPLNGRNFVSLTRTVRAYCAVFPVRTSTAPAAWRGAPRRPFRPTASARATTTSCSTAWTTTRRGCRPS